MTAEQFERERDFCAAIAIAKRMLQCDDINEKDYAAIREYFVQKYRPTICGL